jgi:hypothetical protein
MDFDIEPVLNNAKHSITVYAAIEKIAACISADTDMALTNTQ